MAQPKKVLKNTQSTSASFRGFINLNLSDGDKAHIKSLAMSDEMFVQSMFQKIEEGFKFTFSYDDYSHCYQCIGTPQRKEHTDYGVLLSGRGSTVVKAYKQWLFMVDEVIGGATWESMLNRMGVDEIDD